MKLSPDGWYYLEAARGRLVPKPYSRRWILPAVLGPNERAWKWCTALSLAFTPIVAFQFFRIAGGLDLSAAVFAAVLLSALPGVWRCSWRFPVLVDAPSFLACLVLAIFAKALPWWASFPIALLGGGIRETVPIFAALWAWSPVPLVGLLSVAWFRPSAPIAEGAPEWLTHPVRSAWKLRAVIGLDASLYLRPLGAALAGLAAPSLQTGLTVAAAFAQLFAAQDAIRLTVWCAPVLVMGAAKLIPAAWWPLAILVTVFQRDDRA